MDSSTVVKKGKGYVLKEDETVLVSARAHKMSKSRGNVINPDHVVEKYGADSLRLYEMFMGPLEAVKPWQTSQVSGVVRFRDRVHAVCNAPTSSIVDNICDGHTKREREREREH